MKDYYKRHQLTNMFSGVDSKTRAKVNFDAIDPVSIPPFIELFFFLHFQISYHMG